MAQRDTGSTTQEDDDAATAAKGQETRRATRSESAPALEMGVNHSHSLGSVTTADSDLEGRRPRASSVAQDPERGHLERRQTVAEIWGVNFEAPDETKKKKDWDFLPRRFSRVTSVLPPEVKEVHRKEQRCACSIWVLLLCAFIVYTVIMICQLVAARRKPAQSVKLETDPKMVGLLNVFPNIVVCYPGFAGNAQWLDVSHKPYWWEARDKNKPNLTITYDLRSDTCRIIGDMNKGSCVFIDGSNLSPTTDNLPDRGMELYLAYIRRGGLPSHFIYRGAMMTMTQYPLQRWCNLTGYDLELVEWQETPFDSFQPQISEQNYVPFTSVNVVVKRIIKLSERYVPFPGRSDAREYVQYSFVPRLASYHMGSDAELFSGQVFRQIESVHAQNNQTSANLTETPGVGRFILTQGSGVMEYEDLEPISIPNLFGTLAGAWSGIMTIFTCMFVTTQSGRRRLPAVVRKPYKKVTNVIRKRSSSEISEGDAPTADGIEAKQPPEERDRGLSGWSLGMWSKGSSRRELGGSTRSKGVRGKPVVKREEEEEEDELTVEDRVAKLEKAFMQMLKGTIRIGESEGLADEVKQLKAVVTQFRREGSMESDAPSGGVPDREGCIKVADGHEPDSATNNV